MTPMHEEDFPPGHPARFDYDPDSPEAIEWRRKNVHLKGERDWPVDHPKAIDTEGNTNHVPIVAGVDPLHPELEPFTGRDAETAARMREVQRIATLKAFPSPALEPTIAPQPPKPGDTRPPSGQPGDSTLARVASAFRGLGG